MILVTDICNGSLQSFKGVKQAVKILRLKLVNIEIGDADGISRGYSWSVVTIFFCLLT